jgi:hypothetical protein
MTSLLDVTTRSPFVPLRDAMLCIDCEFVTPAPNAKCSICGSDRLVVLAELLDLLVGLACGSRAPTRLAELASSLVCRPDSVQSPEAQN